MKGWMGCVARRSAQKLVLFSNEFNIALTMFDFNISSISFVPPTVVYYGCWIFSKFHPSLFKVVCSYIFSFTDTHLNEFSTHLMVEKFQQKYYMDEKLAYKSDGDEDPSDPSSDKDSDSESLFGMVKRRISF